ncbi:MAG: hypothetical protein Hens3KO_05580 [Henriciella sp.]
MPQRKKKISTLLDVKTLQNEIVRFEPFEKSHTDLLLSSTAIDELWRWMPAGRKGSGAHSYVDDILQQSDAGYMTTYTLFRKSDDAFAGFAAFSDIDPFHRQIRICFAWHPNDLWNEIFPSAHMLLIQRAHDWQAKRLSWHVSPNNAAAMSAMTFLGATQEARLRYYIRTGDGRWSDIIVFSMLRDEMRQAVTRLKKRISDRLS